MINQTITFIGGGNMARALVGGLVKAGVRPGLMTVADPSAAQRNAAEQDFGIKSSGDNTTAVAGARVIVLAVKPQIMSEVLASIRASLASDCLVISVAAGVTLDAMAEGLGRNHTLVRAMPNTPALYGAGITGLVASPGIDEYDRELADQILGSAGRTVWLDDEALMDVVTAVSGSGPAYFFALTEHLAKAGQIAGLDGPTATLLARQTAVGAGAMLDQSAIDAGELRRLVTSPGGTTEAALDSLAAEGLDALVQRAVDAAVRRGRELGKT